MASEKQFFEDGFVPLENDIIVGRLKIAQSHSGNLRFNEISNAFLEEYKQSVEDRGRKSQILAKTYDAVRRANGRFVKLDSSSKRWYQVTNAVARERIGQQYRDSLKDYYKSSLAHKKKRRLVKSGALAVDDPSLQIQPPPSTPDNKRRKVVAEEAQNGDSSTALKSLVPPIEPPPATEVMAVKAAEEYEGPQTVQEVAIEVPCPLPNSGNEKLDQPGTNTPNTDTDPCVGPFLPRDGIRLMEEGFQPHIHDVLVGLRKRSAQHIGNKFLVEVVNQFLEEYKDCANNKNKKSAVLDKIANVLTTQQDPPARFLRLEPKHNRWYEIEAYHSREKISQCCRDIAQDGYRSCNTFKNLKRRKSYIPSDPPRRRASDEQTKEKDLSTNDVEDAAESSADPSSSKRLPPKKAAARKAAETDSDSNPNADPQPLSRQARKEQIRSQIAQLQKDLEMLEAEERKEQNGAETTTQPPSGDELTSQNEDTLPSPPSAADEANAKENTRSSRTGIQEGAAPMVVDGQGPDYQPTVQLPGMANGEATTNNGTTVPSISQQSPFPMPDIAAAIAACTTASMCSEQPSVPLPDMASGATTTTTTTITPVAMGPEQPPVPWIEE